MPRVIVVDAFLGPIPENPTAGGPNCHKTQLDSFCRRFANTSLRKKSQGFIDLEATLKRSLIVPKTSQNVEENSINRRSRFMDTQLSSQPIYGHTIIHFRGTSVRKKSSSSRGHSETSSKGIIHTPCDCETIPTSRGATNKVGMSCNQERTTDFGTA